MVFTANVFISLSYGSQKKVLRLTFFTPNDYFFVPFYGLLLTLLGTFIRCNQFPRSMIQKFPFHDGENEVKHFCPHQPFRGVFTCPL